jgi:L-alanine-DL-glutamate epimerase-like enolase superfamily enzyme
VPYVAGTVLDNLPQQICGVTAAEWSLPLLAPFRVATRTAHSALNVLVKVTADSGEYGLGAAAPVEYITGESQESVISSLTAIAEHLIGRRIDSLTPILSILQELLPTQPSARAGIEMAIYDLWAKRWNLPLWQFFGGTSSVLTTDMTIPIVTPDEARVLVGHSLAQGFTEFKIKIGDSEGHDADLARLAAVAESAPNCPLRIDANQAFAADAAVAFVDAARKISANIQLIEQPVAKEDLEGLHYVKNHIDVPVFADESARTYRDVKKLIQLEAVDGVNIKLMKSSIVESADIALLCKRNGIRLMVGCMLESPIGIAAASAFAAGIGGIDYIDLDSHKLLKPVNSLTGGFSTNGPKLQLHPTAPGWGQVFVEDGGGTFRV